MDLIERQKAIDAVKDADVCVFYSDNHSIDDVLDYTIRATKGSVIASIEQLSSARPEIIRCKDCKWCENADGSMCKNPASWVVATDRDFGCVLAERRTDQ